MPSDEAEATVFGMEIQAHAPNPADRHWVPLMKGKSQRYRFYALSAAEDFQRALLQSQPHLQLRIVRLA